MREQTEKGVNTTTSFQMGMSSLRMLQSLNKALQRSYTFEQKRQRALTVCVVEIENLNNDNSDFGCVSCDQYP
jgi:hypothetical protein